MANTLTEKMKKQMDFTFEVDANYSEVVCDCDLEYGEGTYGVKVEDGKTEFWYLTEDYWKNQYWDFINDKKHLDQFLALAVIKKAKK